MFIMTSVLAGSVIYLVVHFSRNEESTVNHFEKFTEEKEMYKTKLDAYRALEKDSLRKIKQENIRVDLSALFEEKMKDSGTSKELIPNQMEPSPKKELVTIKQLNTVEKESYKRSVDVLKPESGMESIPSTMEEKPERNTFNSVFINTDQKAEKYTGNDAVLQAVIHGTQEVTSGSTVKLRITISSRINDVVIPENTFIYGIAQLSNERVKVQIQSIKVNSMIEPVQMSVYDTDGLEGIYIPGLQIHEVKEEAVNQTIHDLQQRIKSKGLSKLPLNLIHNENNTTNAVLTSNYEVILK